MGKRTEERLLNAKPRRIWELDFLRGICVLLMIWDHTMYNFGSNFAAAWQASGNATLISLVEFGKEYLSGDLRDMFHPVIFNIFFVICGISCSFSRNNLARGLEALFLSLLITIVTVIIDVPITFGVLHMLSFSILAWWVINTICLRNKYLTALVSLGVGIFIVVYSGIMEQGTYPSDADLFFISKVFGGSHGSTDYFPLLPNMGAMLIGASVGPLLYPKRKSLLPFLDRFGWHQPISFWGRVALPVYVLHQVIIVGIIDIVSYFIIGSFTIIG